MKRILHVYPLNDLMEHETDGKPCPCEPRYVEEANGIMVIHNSCDGREKHERQTGEELVKKVQSSGQRIWIIADVRALAGLPGGVDQAHVCSCGTTFAWKGDERDRPKCPECGK